MERLARILTLLCVALLALASSAFAQAQNGVNARFESGVVKLGSSVQLIVEVEGAKNAADIPALPQVQGLQFGDVGHPGVMQSMSIVNGRQSVSRTLTWSIACRPEQKGEYKVPPFAVKVDGRDVMTRELVLKVVEDLKGAELGALEISAPSTIFEGQPFWIEIRFGFDMAIKDKLNYWNLSLPWLDSLAGLVELDAPGIPQANRAGQVILNSRTIIDVESLGQPKVGNSTFMMLRVRKRFVATRSGKLSFPTSHFEFGAKDNSIGFLRGRDDVVYYKRFPAFDIEVSAVTEEGRPLDWSGAVGAITANASADRRDVDAGDSIKLLVDWSGDANLEFFQPPDLARLDSFKGFRVYGTNDRKTTDRRSVTYDIAPISPDVTEIPRVPLSTFNTQTKTYETVETAPIPIRVRALAHASTLGVEGTKSGVSIDIRDIQTKRLPSASSGGPGRHAIGGISAALIVGWLAARTLVRRRGDPDAPRARARRAARKNLSRTLSHAKSASEQARGLQAFLAARTGETSEAWAGRDAKAWAMALRDSDSALRGVDGASAQISDESARALSDTFARFDERTWAGKDDPLDASSVLALADRLVKEGL